MFGGNVLKRMEKQFISTTKVTKNGESEGDFTCWPTASPNNHHWWTLSAELRNKQGFSILVQRYTVNGRNPAPVGNFQDSYETLKILGWSRDLFHWTTVAGFRNHPQSGTFQTFQDLFAAQQKLSCCVYLTLNSTTTELLNQNNREYQTCFHKIPSLSINSVHKLDSLTWSTYGSCFLKGACVRSPSPSESASLKMASMPRLPGPGDLTIRNWNWTDGKIPFSIDEWENSQFFSGKLGISSWDFF